MIFIKNKYYNWYYGIITKAQNEKRIKTKSQYYEKHHIIPRSLDGDNSNENLVLLTAREHFICHYLLCKMFPEKSDPWYSMLMAFNMMKSTSILHNTNRYFNSYLYEYARKNLSTTMSKYQTGSGNSQYGTCWITHSWIEILRIKIPKHLIEEYIGQGWYGPKTAYRNLLSWENKNLKQNNHKRKQNKNNKQGQNKTKCYLCGIENQNCLCGNNIPTKMLKKLNKYFNLSLDNIGKPEFTNNLNDCKNYAEKLYINKSLADVGQQVGTKANVVWTMFKILKITTNQRYSNNVKTLVSTKATGQPKTQEHKEKIGAANSGKINITNGTINKVLYPPNIVIPDGYWQGLTRKKK